MSAGDDGPVTIIEASEGKTFSIPPAPSCVQGEREQTGQPPAEETATRSLDRIHRATRSGSAGDQLSAIYEILGETGRVVR